MVIKSIFLASLILVVFSNVSFSAPNGFDVGVLLKEKQDFLAFIEKELSLDKNWFVI